MKTEINKSVKRAISLVLAFVLLIGTLFTANVGVNIKAGAETENTDQYADWDNVQYWDGTYLTSFWEPDATGEYEGKYVIRNAAQLQYACACTRPRVAWLSDSTAGKEFVIDPDVDAFIMQPKDAVDEIGLAAFVNASSAEETRILFEEKFPAANMTPVNWVYSANPGIFVGDFDGSGVPIYGIYADGVTKGCDSVAFFDAISAGGDNHSDTTNITDITLENIVIKNSYFKSFRRVAVLIGISWGDNYDKYATVDSCVLGNCYLLGQNCKSDKATVTYNTGEMGVVGGGLNPDPVILSNTLVYGNKTEYDTYVDADEDGYAEDTFTTTSDAFNWAFKSNSSNSVATGSITDCIILDTAVTGLSSQDKCTDVYSDTPTTYTDKVTSMFDNESVKGAHGKFYMSGLDWGTKWYAIKNDYPTPIMPDNYVDIEDREFEGSGTAEDPYIIRSAKQLYSMVAAGCEYGTDTDKVNAQKSVTPKYYKVADDVKEIYLNNDVKTKEQAKALYSNNDKSKYNNWFHSSKAFQSHFDGNGVTIYGMISSNRGSSGLVGFVPVISTVVDDVTIKNVNFVGAYIDSNNSAAVVSSQVSSWGLNDGLKPTAYISSVTVRDSFIQAANSGATFEVSGTTSDGNTTTGNGHNATAAGILSTNSITPDHVTITNCLYDGASCELYDSYDSNATTQSASAAAAGIVSMNSTGNEITVDNCVSIGVNAIPMMSEVNYDIQTRYSKSAHEFNTVYGVIPDGFDTSIYAECATCYNIGDKAEDGDASFTMLDMQYLNWGGAWTLETLADGRTIPMPKKSDETVDSYMQQILNLNGGRGMINTVDGSGYEAGTYGQYQSFKGSGTADDPYIISDALELAIAIACGGKNQYSKLHYELACDIDVGSSWITTQYIAGKYKYVPFEGTLDGKGHTVYNLYSVSVDEYVGLIPKIADGATVKNLHIRDSYIASGETIANYDPGAIFGGFNGESGTVNIEGCSYETKNEDVVRFVIGDFSKAEVTNSYCICYNADNTVRGYKYYVDCKYDGGLKGIYTTSPTGSEEAGNYVASNNFMPTPEKVTVNDQEYDADFYGEEGVTDPVWYIGGEEDSLPQLVNRAKAMSEVDISGYGDNDYDTNDITSLRQRLLNNPAYANVYGDVNRDGKTNLGDLVILRRFLVNTYDMYADGFWRNAALGNIVIYYGENDNYDFARKLELVLEAEFGKDVKKVVVGNGERPGTDVSWGSTNGGLYVHQNDIYYNSTNGNYYKLNKAATGAITPELLDPTNDAAEIAQYELDGNCQIVVGNVTGYDNNTLGDNNYLISYDKTKAAVWLQGGSFTAVEQATLDFISNSDPYNSKVYDADGVEQTLATEKVAIPVGTTTYYYAWGDEFDDGKLNLDNWHHASMQNETTDSGGRYENLEVAYVADMEQLYEVTTNDVLRIWRGYYGAGTEATGWAADQGYKYLGTMADNIGTNEFGGNIEQGDFYVTAGKIDTSQSMLAKQGYIEFNVKYPSDGNVFACLWMYGTRLTHSNSGISNGLFGKVLKLNNAAAYANAATNTNGEGLAWDGTTNTMDSRDPSTYKYQMPNASYEIDIVELMQSGQTKVNESIWGDTYESNAVNTYRTANFTFHKYFDGGIYTEDDVRKVKFIDWDNTLSNGEAKYFSAASKYSLSSYSTPVDTFLCDTVTNTSTTWNYGMKLNDTDKGEIFSGTTHQVDTTDDMMTIGVEWDISDDSNHLFTFYVDDTEVGTVTEDIAYNEDDSRYLKNLTKIVSDASTANQYMYLLIDNSIFTSETGDNERYTDKILTYEDGDTTVMEIDYVRVYQKDGKRDIVTPETEDFNNGNHFGY